MISESGIALRTIVACAALITLQGCELFLGANTAENFPPPGQIVDIDGRKLQIDCRGSGSPTVVLESGGNDIFGAPGWLQIQEALAESTRVCAYTRAGYLWSDSAPATPDAEDGARALHAALRLADAQPPFVLVGHSSGALNNLIFTDMFSSEVAGLVFAEPSHPEQDIRRAQEGLAPGDELPLRSVKVLRALRWTGLPRAFSGYCSQASRSPQVISACKAWFPRSLDGIIDEARLRPAIDTRAARVQDLGDRPVLVLTRQFQDEWYGNDAATKAELQRREAHWRELHAEMAAWSSRGEQRLVPDSGHDIVFTHPQVVVDGITEIVELVRR